MLTLHNPLTSRVHYEAPSDRPLASYASLIRCIKGWTRYRPSASSALIWRRSTEAASIARRVGACDALITAALLRRLGDLAPAASAKIATAQEAVLAAHVGADLLSDLYPPLVTETIRLQPSAQRYLASAGNAARLGRPGLADSGCLGSTPMSMSELERACFAALPFATPRSLLV